MVTIEKPSTKRFRLYNALIAYIENQRIRVGQTISILDFLGNCNVSLEEWEIHYRRNNSAIKTIGKYDTTKKTFTPLLDYRAYWQDSVLLFKDICRRLFEDKDQEALIYEAPDRDYLYELRRRWMSPDDVKFLIAIGIRALIEECWRNRVMLLGIVKDSESRYYTRNHLGVMRHIDVYDKVDTKLLPWTDRIVLEDIAYQVPELKAPWSTTEFDSCFMTLHLGRYKDSNIVEPMGVRGDIVNQERLFARSLSQFFLHRKAHKSTPLMGHVIFIDRLLDPYWDSELCSCEDAIVTTRELGTIKPFLHRNNTTDNMGQKVAMYFLNTLTRNLFPEAIGYPDPLHKADWGAKTVGRRVADIIADSAITFRANPISKAFRTIRDSVKR